MRIKFSIFAIFTSHFINYFSFLNLATNIAQLSYLSIQALLENFDVFFITFFWIDLQSFFNNNNKWKAKNFCRNLKTRFKRRNNTNLWSRTFNFFFQRYITHTIFLKQFFVEKFLFVFLIVCQCFEMRIRF